MSFIKQDNQILKENGFNTIKIDCDGVIRLPKSALNAGLGKKLRDLGIKSKIKTW